MQNDADFDLERTRDALIAARRAARPLATVDRSATPPDLDAAYRLQRDVAGAFGPTRGWKISGLTADQQRSMGVDRPLAGPLLAPFVVSSGGAFELRNFIRPRLECEFAFELDEDLPPRANAYARADVERAIGAVRIGLEVVDSRLPPGSPLRLELADALNNGAYVVGTATAAWRALRFDACPIELRHVPADGSAVRVVASGSGRAILDGDPLGAVVLLANLDALRPQGLRAGDIVTTGSCTGALDVPGPGDYEADFGALGIVRMRLS